MQSASKRSEVAWAAQSSSHFPVQPKTDVAGHVGEVGDRAVRVAARDWTPRSGRSSGCARGSLPRRRRGRRASGPPAPACARTAIWPFAIRCAPTTPAKPTSITLRCASTLSPTRKPARKTAAAGEQPDRPDRPAGARRPVAPGDPDAAAEQVDERRVRERRAPEDLALVEEAERDREREQREQVEVAQRAEPPQVGETDEEEARRSRARATAR